MADVAMNQAAMLPGPGGAMNMIMLVNPPQMIANAAAVGRQSTGSSRGVSSSSSLSWAKSSSSSSLRSDRSGRGTATGKVGWCRSLKTSLTPSRW
jgi:hypothetical protein